MSASITSERANLRKRGTLLAYIFANQGWGSLVGSVVVLIVLLCYKHTMNVEGHTSKVDGGTCLHAFIDCLLTCHIKVWRIVIGLSLIPALGTLYQRLTLPESTRFLASQKLKKEEDEIATLKKAALAEEQAMNEKKVPAAHASDNSVSSVTPDDAIPIEAVVKKKAQFTGAHDVPLSYTSFL